MDTETGTPVTCSPITSDSRHSTGHDGPRTRTHRNRDGYATT
ncbi:hypothetical protein Q5530_16505 [Saccharothrix sp. BKS2]|uniref:Uncharacterized protein n=1 Tax=Saccharothrix lopnurensis TaxID=1670621 RepID=A0ABW1P992_9PSEU